MESNKDLRFEIASEILAAGFHRDRAIAVADEIFDLTQNGRGPDNLLAAFDIISSVGQFEG